MPDEIGGLPVCTDKPALLDESGASAVEFALVMPVLVLFLVGIMDFGMIFSNLMALHQGIGEGIRQGVIARPGTNSSCTLTGLSADTSLPTKSLICLTKDRIGFDGTRVKVSFPGSKTKGEPCCSALSTRWSPSPDFSIRC